MAHGESFLTTISVAYSEKILVRAFFRGSPCKLLPLGSSVCLYPSGHFLKPHQDILHELCSPNECGTMELIPDFNNSGFPAF